MEASGEASLVELRIPCKPEYVGVARLAMLGVASRMRFSYDEVEDVRLAVGEACTTAVEWAARNARENSNITVRSSITDTRLVIDIIDQAGERRESSRQAGDNEQEGLGALLITLLVDEVIVNSIKDGIHIQMVKNVG